MLVIITGTLGSGKTLLMTYFYLISKKKYHYTNYYIKTYHNKKVIPFKIQNIFEIKDNSNLYLDEGYLYLESRTSTALLNRILSYLLFQSRKRDLNIYITAQSLGTIDKRFRELCDYIITCKYERENDVFIYNFFGKNGHFTFFIPYSKATKIFKYYRTRQIIDGKVLQEAKISENLSAEGEKYAQMFIEKNNIIDPKKVKKDAIKYFISQTNTELVGTSALTKLTDIVYTIVKNKSQINI